MGLILFALAAGVIIGAGSFLPASWLARLPKLTTITLLLLLVVLGAQIGSSSELLAGLPVLGWRAAVFGGLTIAGSLAAILLVGRWFDLADGDGEGE
jgi:prepilin signal peptidase PulO-like enzyme (type II secretory pathway)